MGMGAQSSQLTMLSHDYDAVQEADTTIYDAAQQQPSFDGGDKELLKYIKGHGAYSVDALNGQVERRVVCRFVVEREGSLTNIEVLRSGGHEALDKEAVRILQSMPPWQPGRIDNQTVRVRYTLSIPFTMKDAALSADNVDLSDKGKEVADDQYYKANETMPEFPGGQIALLNYLRKNIRYPKTAKKAKVEGSVIVRFVVDKDGTVTDVYIARSTGDFYLDMEAVRVVRSMPKWKPGTRNGEYVLTPCTVPINFKLE